MWGYFAFIVNIFNKDSFVSTTGLNILVLHKVQPIPFVHLDIGTISAKIPISVYLLALQHNLQLYLH